MDEVNPLTKLEKAVFVFLTMMISGASSIVSNDFIRIIVVGLLVLYSSMNQKQLYNNVLLYLLSGWISINLISSLYFGKSINLYPFIGKIVLVYLAYLCLSCCKVNFWDRYERFLYKLVLISTVFYVLSLLLPGMFNSLTSVFRPFTADVFYQKESQKHYFYAFFFTYMGQGNFRNSGFMWEPGAYAMILNILITYNICKQGVQFNRHIKVYTLILLTTFSTAGYLAFFIILLLFLLKGQNIYVKVFVLTGTFFSIGWLMNADFLLPKIEEFISSTQKGIVYQQGYRKLYEANRILSFKLLTDKFLMFPMGWGCTQDTTSYMALKHIVTVNGLGNTLVTWGIFAFSFFMYSIGEFFYQYRQSIIIVAFSLLVVCISFFSNPIENNILLYLLVLSPYIVEFD